MAKCWKRFSSFSFELTTRKRTGTPATSICPGTSTTETSPGTSHCSECAGGGACFPAGGEASSTSSTSRALSILESPGSTCRTGGAWEAGPPLHRCCRPIPHVLRLAGRRVILGVDVLEATVAHEEVVLVDGAVAGEEVGELRGVRASGALVVVEHLPHRVVVGRVLRAGDLWLFRLQRAARAHVRVGEGVVPQEDAVAPLTHAPHTPPGRARLHLPQRRMLLLEEARGALEEGGGQRGQRPEMGLRPATHSAHVLVDTVEHGVIGTAPILVGDADREVSRRRLQKRGALAARQVELDAIIRIAPGTTKPSMRVKTWVMLVVPFTERRPSKSR